MTNSWPAILVFKEKYGDRHFVVNNQKEESKVFLKILREREREGYFYPSLEDLNKENNSNIERLREREKLYTSLTEEEFSNLPEILKATADESKARFEKSMARNKAYYDAEIKFRDLLNKVLNAEEKDSLKMTLKFKSGRTVPLVKYLVDSRSDFEYEGYDFIQPEEV